jgi:hypothetical protein
VNKLEDLRIATPCKANWAEMLGNDQMRYCALCKLNVYNLSGMTREEAEGLVKANEGKICVSFFKRADGTVLTQDCPVGVAARIKRRVASVAAGFAAFAALGWAAFAGRGGDQVDGALVEGKPPVVKQDDPKIELPKPEHIMGRIRCPVDERTTGTPMPAEREGK